MGPENQGYVPPEAKKPPTVGETELEKNWFIKDEKPPQTETNNDDKVNEEEWFKKDEAA